MTDNIHFKIKGAYQHDAIENGICFQRSWHSLKYQKALQLLELNENDTVLDAACGSGVLTGMMAEKYKCRVVGADFSTAAIEFCKRQYIHTNLEFITLDLTDKYFGEDAFSKIVMLEIVEHLQPDATTKILKNIYTYLQPGGKLIISTPNKNSLWPVIELMLDTLGLTPKMKNEQHVQLYTKKTLRTVLLQHGFKVNLIESSHFLAPWLSFFGLKAAEKIHSLEQKIKIFPGSLLFAIVEKE